MDLKLFRFLVRDEEVEKSLMRRGATTDILRETLLKGSRWTTVKFDGILDRSTRVSMERVALKNNRME